MLCPNAFGGPATAHDRFHWCRTISLKSLLDEFKHQAGLGTHWIMFGSNGHQERPVDGGMMKHYTACNPSPHTHFKIIANTFFLERTTHHPHNMLYWYGRILCLLPVVSMVRMHCCLSAQSSAKLHWRSAWSVEQAAICRGAAVPVNEHHYPLGHLPQAELQSGSIPKDARWSPRMHAHWRPLSSSEWALCRPNCSLSLCDQVMERLQGQGGAWAWRRRRHENRSILPRC